MVTKNLPLYLLMGQLMFFSNSAYAQQRQGRRTNSQAGQSIVNRQATGGVATTEKAGGDQQQVMARVRGYQLLLEREEKKLSQRLAHAAQLRQQGLQKKDARLLDQAEQYERKALAAYQARIQQFEQTDLTSGIRKQSPQRKKDSRVSQGKQTTSKSQVRRRSPQAQRKTSQRRSPRSANNMWSWLR